jgi:membrane associated rhomboid family serine protease
MIPLHDDNPTSIFPLVTMVFIVTCVLTFLWELSLGERSLSAAMFSYGVTPATLLGPKQLPPELYRIPAVATMLTSMFLHGGWMHLIGNMLYLWIFGNNVEDAMGHGRFVVFYLLCGIAAALAQAMPNPQSTIPMIGASGAISGVLGAYLLLYPRARVLVFVPLGFLSRAIYLPAIFVLGFWFVLQLINSALAPSEGGGVAWGAHVGGFIAGIVLIPLFKYRRVRLFAPAHRRS